jgi:23S rRNA pseudouridine1911/1915/1917 synthase
LEEKGLRLDTFLSMRVTWRSRNDLQRRIHDLKVLLDGRPPRKSARLQPGQTVTVFVDEGPATLEVPVDRIPLRILHEDAALVAIDKAAGTVVHPVGRHVMDTGINALHARAKARGELAAAPRIVHRLDRDTSGVLVLAKDAEARRILGADFENRRVEKSYLALVEGHVVATHGTIDLPIGPDSESEIRLKMACRPDGRASSTVFEVVSRHCGFTLVRCFPRTGRQHQIRVHLAALGHPILCDHLYGRAAPLLASDLDPGHGDPDRVILARQALHAESLTFRHPVTGESMHLEVPLAPDLEAVCRAMPGGGAGPAPPDHRGRAQR